MRTLQNTSSMDVNTAIQRYTTIYTEKKTGQTECSKTGHRDLKEVPSVLRGFEVIEVASRPTQLHTVATKKLSTVSHSPAAYYSIS